MVGYTTEGISNQEQTRWLSWNVDGGVRGFDLARNPGLCNNTECGAGEFPLPARPPAGLAAQLTSRLSSVVYDTVSTDRGGIRGPQVILERDQAWCDLNMIRAEYQQEQRVREIEANCEQLKSEMEKLQRRQRELARQKEKRTRTTEPAATASRPESRIEVDEAPRPSGRFNLDRVAQEPMNEGLRCGYNPNRCPQCSLDTQSIRPLMEVKLPGYTPSSTTSSSQAGSSSSRLKVLEDSLQSRARDDSVREGPPSTWRNHPVRSVTIASYKKSKDGAYHRHNRMGPPRPLLSVPLDPYPAVWERELIREIVRGAAGPGNQGPHRWKLRRRSLPRPRVRWCLR